MKILFLGDIVGDLGFKAVKNNLPEIVKSNKIDFVCVNAENAASEGMGLTENITSELYNIGVDVITTGNHVWDKKEIFDLIKEEKKLLRPLHFEGDMPGNGFSIFNSKKNLRVGVLNLIGNDGLKLTAIGNRLEHKLEDHDINDAHDQAVIIMNNSKPFTLLILQLVPIVILLWNWYFFFLLFILICEVMIEYLNGELPR